MKRLEIRHISIVYPKGIHGLDDVGLKLEQGEFVSIIGLSGPGKSTLLRSINRLVDISCEVIFLKEEISSSPREKNCVILEEIIKTRGRSSVEAVSFNSYFMESYPRNCPF